MPILCFSMDNFLSHACEIIFKKFTFLLLAPRHTEFWVHILGFFFMRNLIWPISFWPYHTLTYLLLHMFSFLLCLWKKSYFLLCVAYYFRYGLNHTATYLFRGLIPFTHLYPNVAQNKSVSWSLTTSTWLFHWHIKKQCHNATLYSALIVVSIGVVIRNKGPSSTTLLGPQLHKMHM